MMAFDRRQIVVVLLLFLLLVSSTAVPITGGLKTVNKPILFEDSHSQDVEERDKDDDMLEGRRKDIEIEDYPGTGANPSHDPSPPGRV